VESTDVECFAILTMWPEPRRRGRQVARSTPVLRIKAPDLHRGVNADGVVESEQADRLSEGMRLAIGAVSQEDLTGKVIVVGAELLFL
jgi:hypothetical protein